MRDEPDGMLPGVRERDQLVRRSWTRSERRVVLNGLFGRLLVAIEPVICFVVFGALTAGLIFFPLPAGSKLTHWESAIVLAPIFGLAAFAFFGYGALLLVAPLRALIQTFSPIYIVDGYIRYRKPDRHTDGNSNGYIAVLSEERRLVAEWPNLGDVPLVDGTRPALVEFSFFGGIHRIDGRSTGVLPETMSPMGVGANTPRM